MRRGVYAARLEHRSLLEIGQGGASRCSLRGMLFLAVVVALGLFASDLVELAQRPQRPERG
jgi:hypothetical protein